MNKEDDILNACGHRNSERVKALKELPSAVCPACLLERITDLEKAVKEWRNKADSELDINAKLHTLTAKLQQQVKGYEVEIQEVANQLMDLYDKCIETTEPEIFGTILGLHERLEEALN